MKNRIPLIARNALVALTLFALGLPELALARWVEREQDKPKPHPQEQQQEQEQQQQQHREDEEREKDKKKKPKRVSQQEQRQKIEKQEADLQLYRRNLALKEEVAQQDARILQQQKRIAQLRFQQRYEERLRAQRAALAQARFDYYNDPFFYTAPDFRYRRDGRFYTTNEYGIDALKRALNEGYKEGFRAGRADREDRWRYEPRSSFAYRDANFGFDGRYLAQDEYNHYFREGFERGYEDGYYGRRKYGSGGDDNDEWWIAAGVIGAILAVQAIND